MILPNPNNCPKNHSKLEAIFKPDEIEKNIVYYIKQLLNKPYLFNQIMNRNKSTLINDSTVINDIFHGKVYPKRFKIQTKKHKLDFN
ncbi:hypothetical protein BpHYR1_041591 [Brachionus plicatilis]|uniref:Uncharacterized protein n=1 Tax=Brachionus plicatilis TaxID=10195 RepID=A0A3M7SRA0_BRAPC|nr:hypothetical protein BpHYR1_041591 [Brachionus plicatilis]